MDDPSSGGHDGDVHALLRGVPQPAAPEWPSAPPFLPGPIPGEQAQSGGAAHGHSPFAPAQDASSASVAARDALRRIAHTPPPTQESPAGSAAHSAWNSTADGGASARTLSVKPAAAIRWASSVDIGLPVGSGFECKFTGVALVGGHLLA